MARREIKNFEGCLSIVFRFFGLFDQKDAVQSLPYRRRESVLSAAEHRFYVTLNKAVDNRALIIPKVGLQDVFFITDQENYQSARNRISQRHVDFLLCEENTLRPLFGIELDDGSHNESSNKKRDEFKNKVFEAAMLPLVRVPVTRHFDTNELKAIIQPYFKKDEITTTPPVCPRCGNLMIQKTARHGEFKGKDFYACTNYPTCRGIINIPST